MRELRNVIERLLIMVPGDTISIEHLTFLDGVVRAGELAGRTVRCCRCMRRASASERDYILRTLAEQQGNISRTAEVLDVERSSLYRRCARSDRAGPADRRSPRRRRRLTRARQRTAAAAAAGEAP